MVLNQSFFKYFFLSEGCLQVQSAKVKTLTKTLKAEMSLEPVKVACQLVFAVNEGKQIAVFYSFLWLSMTKTHAFKNENETDKHTHTHTCTQKLMHTLNTHG